MAQKESFHSGSAVMTSRPQWDDERGCVGDDDGDESARAQARVVVGDRVTRVSDPRISGSPSHSRPALLSESVTDKATDEGKLFPLVNNSACF
ncbi:hypothetical protein J6590_052107 [Homalodisca vitripennis]|nr:hypothetical protein J6590_052107 [Homalodisca vitripennis]